MRTLLITLLSALTMPLFAQQSAEFKKYINRFHEVKLPFPISQDSTVTFDLDSVTTIPERYVKQFLFNEKQVPTFFFNEAHEFKYGDCLKTKNFILTTVTKNCDCGSAFGLGISEIILSTYTPKGEKISQKIIASRSQQHMFEARCIQSDSKEAIIQVNTRNGIYMVCYTEIPYTSLGIVEYKTIHIDNQGRMQEKYIKTTQFSIQNDLYTLDGIKEW